MSKADQVRWSITDLAEICKKRVANRMDVIIAFSGSRGQGKSTGALKLCHRFEQFKLERDVIYRREDAMKLMEENKFHVIMDDEAIVSAFKRGFSSKEQNDWIRMLNMYRNHCNVYILCIPNFYSLDKEIRRLVKIHINVVRRGTAHIHLPHEERIYADDPWNESKNAKIEERWMKKKNKRSAAPKLTTYYGSLEYGPLTPRIEERYEEIKSKRNKIFEVEVEGVTNQRDIWEKALKLLERETFYSIEQFYRWADEEGYSIDYATQAINKRLKMAGKPTITKYLKSMKPSPAELNVIEDPPKNNKIPRLEGVFH